MEILAKIGEWLKLSPKYIFALLLFSSAMLFFPDTFLSTLGILEFKESYKFWFGVIFLGSFSILLAHLLASVMKKIKFSYDLHNYKKEMQYLTPAEKEVLKNYIENDLISNDLRITDGVVRALEAKMILVRSSTISSAGEYFPYNIQPWAAKYLKKHLDLLN